MQSNRLMSAGGFEDVSSVIISEEGELLKGGFADQISKGQTDAWELDFVPHGLDMPEKLRYLCRLSRMNFG